MIEIKISYSPKEIKALAEKGYIPIECALGSISIVDGYALDHHNEFSHLEGVALRAYRDLWGRAPEGKFVVTGNCDADASFAIAALAGLVPKSEDMMELAKLINEVDTMTTPVSLLKKRHGPALILWNKLIKNRKELGWYSGVYLWPALLDNPAVETMARGVEKERIVLANNCKKIYLKQVLYVESPVWGFDQWYRNSEIVVAFVRSHKKLTVGVKDEETAKKLFGPKGLLEIYGPLDQLLELKGFGGRPTVGGSPKGAEITREMAYRVAQFINDVIDEIKNQKQGEKNE